MRLAAAERQRDAPIDVALIRADVLVSEGDEDDDEAGNSKEEAGGYVPLPKDDTGILDLGVPVDTR